MRYLLAFCFLVQVVAEQRVATYTRFCATCGIWGADTVVSQSGQFIVHGTTSTAFPPLRRTGEPPLIELEPQLVAVTAERARLSFLEELGIENRSFDKIHVMILARARPEQAVGLVAHQHSDGFEYQIGFPAYVESSRLIKALVQSLLQEFANRAANRSAELPSWLVEGMTRELLSSVMPAPVLNRQPLTVERTGYDRLGTTRRYFQTNSPLTIQDLSFNNLPALSEAERLRYENSAHLLVYELLRLKGGPELLRQFIQNLPRTLNWQTAFFSAYQQYFRTPLDLEKWWMLNCVQTRNTQARETWATPASLERLESVLRVPIELRSSTNAIPQKRDSSIQEVLTSLDFSVQKEVLGQKLQQIFFLSVNLSPEVARVANAYEQAIDSYLQKRALGEYQPTLRSDPEQRLQALVNSTIKSFDDLDAAREDLREGRTPNLPQPPRKPGRQVLISRGSSRK